MERRKIARTNCEFPLKILRIGGSETLRPERTTNISLKGGICFRSARPLDVNQRVEYDLTVSQGPSPLRLLCAGHVVRCSRVRDDRGRGHFDIALTMERYRFAPTDDDVPLAFLGPQTTELRISGH